MATNVSGLEFTFDSPEEAGVDEEFNVVINADPAGEIYDVKVFVYQETKSNIISEVFFDGEWKNPWFYLQGVFPVTNVYNNKVLENVGETEICVRLRKAGAGGFDEVCKDINVNSGGENNAQINNSNSDSEEEEDEFNSNENKPASSQDGVGIILTSHNVIDNVDQEKKKIVLGFVEEEKVEEKIITKQEKVRRGVVYSFVGFLVLLIVLLALRRL